MNFHITLTPEQFAFLSDLLDDAVQLYEHQAAALGGLLGEAARELAQARLDASQNAAELAALLAEIGPDPAAPTPPPLPEDILTTTREVLLDYQKSLEAEAAALARIPAARSLEKNIMEMSQLVGRLRDFYLNL